MLRQDIVSHDCWFEKREDNCEYLSYRCGSRMSNTNLDPKSINEKRQKKGHKIKDCMSKHIFEYVPNFKKVYNRKYLCECEECINLVFSSCLTEVIELDEAVEQINVETNTEIEEKND